jgi:hypothetical protein
MNARRGGHQRSQEVSTSPHKNCARHWNCKGLARVAHTVRASATKNTSPGGFGTGSHVTMEGIAPNLLSSTVGGSLDANSSATLHACARVEAFPKLCGPHSNLSSTRTPRVAISTSEDPFEVSVEAVLCILIWCLESSRGVARKSNGRTESRASEGEKRSLPQPSSKPITSETMTTRRCELCRGSMLSSSIRAPSTYLKHHRSQGTCSVEDLRSHITFNGVDRSLQVVLPLARSRIDGNRARKGCVAAVIVTGSREQEHFWTALAQMDDTQVMCTCA